MTAMNPECSSCTTLRADLTHLREQVAQDHERRTCNDCKRELPWWGVDEAGRCGRCYESMNLTRERKRAEAAEATVTALRETLETVNAALRGVVRVADRQTIEFDAAKAAVRTVEAVLCGREASAQQSPVFGATNAHQKTDTLLALVKEASEIMDITYAGNFPAGIESFLVRASHVLQGREQEKA